MIRVLLADDESVIRIGVRTILGSDPAIDVVAEAGDGREAVELARRHGPDVALLDIKMPHMDGIDATAEIVRSVPGVAVVVLTTFGEDEHISRALAAGASGFLLKSGDPRELISGVHAVADGAACLSPSVARRVIAGLGQQRTSRAAAARARTDVLTEREREVLVLVGTGLSNTQIANRLHLVEGTVKTHVSSILRRLDVNNRVSAAVLAYEAGMLDAGL